MKYYFEICKKKNKKARIVSGITNAHLVDMFLDHKIRTLRPLTLFQQCKPLGKDSISRWMPLIEQEKFIILCLLPIFVCIKYLLINILCKINFCFLLCYRFTYGPLGSEVIYLSLRSQFPHTNGRVIIIHQWCYTYTWYFDTLEAGGFTSEFH